MAGGGGRIIVIGGGVVGLACAASLARGGAEVVVLERFEHVHNLGSHGGHTRVTRRAYHEGSAYVPLCVESEERWQELECEEGAEGAGSILVRCGLIEAGPVDDRDLKEVFAACVAHGLEHRVHDAAALWERYGLRVSPEWIGCETPSGGYLRVGAAMNGLRRAAMAAGASFRYQTEVKEIVCGQTLRVLLESGELLPCERIVVAAGAYLQRLLPSRLRDFFAVRRRILAWSTPPAEARERLAKLPVWAVFAPQGMYYGFPYGDHGVAGFKLACHRYWAPSDPEDLSADVVERRIAGDELDELDGFLAEFLPAARGPWASAEVCLYNCTPSGDFLVDRHPDDARVILAGGFSGHGFKFAPVIARLVGELLDGGEAAGVPSIFRWSHHLAGPSW
ncbi:MAG TPA: N-methyl-L-tryptophan oxidase [Nannocystis exedens]|nr:N-methyl-L-tryptophan oxidase [Nannocystis exedens]